MTGPKKIALYLLLVTIAVGCVDDYPLISRETLAIENELLDGLMKVVDEDSAKDYTKHRDAIKKIREADGGKRLEKWKANLEKKETKDFDEYVAKREEFVKKDVMPEPDAFAKYRMPAVYYRVTRETVALNRAHKREAARLKNVVADLVKRKITELQGQGDKNPNVNPAQEWPALYGLASAGSGSAPGQANPGGQAGVPGPPKGGPGPGGAGVGATILAPMP